MAENKTTDDLSAEALLDRFCRHGDVAAVGALFDAQAPGLYRLAVSLCGDPATAEDLLQQTFLAALDGIDRFEQGRTVGPWLVGILKNMARRAGRERARRPDLERLVASRDMRAKATDDDERVLLREAIDMLGAPYRAIALLHYVHGLPAAEIAHLRSEPPGTVRSALSRARQKLESRMRIAPAILLASACPRGLDAVRDVVVEHASLSAGTATAGLALGGLVVTKKLLVLGGVMLFAVLATSLGLGLFDTASDDPGSTVSGDAGVLGPIGSGAASADPTEGPILIPAVSAGSAPTPTACASVLAALDAQDVPLSMKRLEEIARREGLESVWNCLPEKWRVMAVLSGNCSLAPVVTDAALASIGRALASALSSEMLAGQKGPLDQACASLVASAVHRLPSPTRVSVLVNLLGGWAAPATIQNYTAIDPRITEFFKAYRSLYPERDARSFFDDLGAAWEALPQSHQNLRAKYHMVHFARVEQDGVAGIRFLVEGFVREPGYDREFISAHPLFPHLGAALRDLLTRDGSDSVRSLMDGFTRESDSIRRSAFWASLRVDQLSLSLRKPRVQILSDADRSAVSAWIADLRREAGAGDPRARYELEQAIMHAASLDIDLYLDELEARVKARAHPDASLEQSEENAFAWGCANAYQSASKADRVRLQAGMGDMIRGSSEPARIVQLLKNGPGWRSTCRMILAALGDDLDKVLPKPLANTVRSNAK